MKLDTIYTLTSQASAELGTRQFPIAEWQVYDAIAAAAGTRTARVISQQLGIAPEEMKEILRELHDVNLIHLPAISYEEFKALANRPTAPAPAKESHLSVTVAPVASDPPGKITFALRRQPKPSVSPAGKEGALKLGRLVRLIRERAGGGSLGQLSVYRMFLKIPSELLQAAGLEQFDLDAANGEVDHPELAAALRGKACELLGVRADELAALLDA